MIIFKNDPRTFEKKGDHQKVINVIVATRSLLETMTNLNVSLDRLSTLLHIQKKVGELNLEESELKFVTFELTTILHKWNITASDILEINKILTIFAFTGFPQKVLKQELSVIQERALCANILIMDKLKEYNICSDRLHSMLLTFETIDFYSINYNELQFLIDYLPTYISAMNEIEREV
jgi:hypothetical protein